MKISDDQLKQIDRAYRPLLRNLDVEHPRLIVVFSGPPGSGKSTIARAIEQQFSAIRLENDAIRRLASQLYPDTSLEWKSELTYTYMEALYEELAATATNGLWVIDGSVDRRFKIVETLARKYHFPMVLLAMDIPPDIHEQRIRNAGDREFATTEEYLNNLSRQRQQQEVFLASYTPDFVIKPATTNEEVCAFVALRIKNLARQPAKYGLF